jgi:GTP diphosphokinase / guanosine-3',5'-bis(diphosphate) 3'-diphosphatase
MGTLRRHRQGARAHPPLRPTPSSALSTVIAKNEGNITNLKIVNRTQQFWEMLIDVEVRNVKHLTNVIAALRATPAINSVERARG